MNTVAICEPFPLCGQFLPTPSANLRFPTLLLPRDQLIDIPPLRPRLSNPSPTIPTRACNFPGESVSLNDVILYLDQRRDGVVDVNDLVSHFCVKRKTVFDFMSIMCALGIASKATSNEFLWRGAHRLDDAVAFVTQARSDSPDRTLDQEFTCAKDASLGNISLLLLKLFAALGVDVLDLRKVATLLGKHHRYPSMLRRLVTISSCLQVVNVVRMLPHGETVELVNRDILAACAPTPAAKSRLEEFTRMKVIC